MTYSTLLLLISTVEYKSDIPDKEDGRRGVTGREDMGVSSIFKALAFFNMLWALYVDPH